MKKRRALESALLAAICQSSFRAQEPPEVPVQVPVSAREPATGGGSRLLIAVVGAASAHSRRSLHRAVLLAESARCVAPPVLLFSLQ